MYSFLKIQIMLNYTFLPHPQAASCLQLCRDPLFLTGSGDRIEDPAVRLVFTTWRQTWVVESIGGNGSFSVAKLHFVELNLKKLYSGRWGGGYVYRAHIEFGSVCMNVHGIPLGCLRNFVWEMIFDEWLIWKLSAVLLTHIKTLGEGHAVCLFK